MNQLRAEMKVHLTTQFDQFVQSQEAALNALIHRQEEQFLLVQQLVTGSNGKMSKLESDMEILKQNIASSSEQNDTTPISLVEEMRQIKGLVIQTQEAIDNLQLQVNSFVKSIKSPSQQGNAAETFACQTESESSAETVESEKNEESKPSSSDDTDDSTEFEVIRQSTKGINNTDFYRF